MAWHHPDKTEYPDWVIWLNNQLFHKVCTIVQRMRVTTENLAVIRGLIDALEYEYLCKRRVMDQIEKIGPNEE